MHSLSHPKGGIMHGEVHDFHPRPDPSQARDIATGVGVCVFYSLIELFIFYLSSNAKLYRMHNLFHKTKKAYRYSFIPEIIF